MGKNAAGLPVTKLQRSGRQRFAWAIDYNFDYVICCGIKAPDKLRRASGKMSFLFGGRENYSKMQALDFYLLDWMILVDCCL